MIQKAFLKVSLSLVLIMTLVAFATPTYAQETITLQEERIADFNPKNILKSRAKGYLFKVGDNELQVIGRKGENLEAILMQDEEAYKQFKRFKRKLVTGKVVFWTSVGTHLGSSYWQFGDNSIEVYEEQRLIRLSAIVVGGAATIAFRALAIRNLKKSIRVYNENLEKS